MACLFYSKVKGTRKVMDNRMVYKELKRNTFIIAISNIGSKAITFILAPLYSYFLSTSQYGTMDLITTTVSLIIPFVCLDIFEATFRYSNDKEYDDNKVLSSSLAVCVPCLIIAFAFLIGSLIIAKGNIYIPYTIAYVVLGAFINIVSQYARGNKEMKVFASTGIINSFVLLITNAIFLILLKLELNGWLISYLIAQLAASVYLTARCKVYRRLSAENVDREYIKTFLRFCTPLIPTAAMWWVMNASDRYMITFFLGAGFNGIYAAANKLPTILSVFENVFYQSWQTTAISTMNDKERDRIYSNVFNKYLIILTIGVLGLLLIGKPLLTHLFAKDYYSAWIPLAPLIVSVLIHALAGNLGSLYSVFKSTNGALYSTIIGAGTNIVLNFAVIPIIGIYGAALTTLIGYIVTLIYRWFDVKKFVHLKLKKTDLLLCFGTLIIQFALYYFEGILSYCIRGLILVAMVVIYRNDILRLIHR